MPIGGIGYASGKLRRRATQPHRYKTPETPMLAPLPKYTLPIIKKKPKQPYTLPFIEGTPKPRYKLPIIEKKPKQPKKSTGERELYENATDMMRVFKGKGYRGK